MLLQRVLRRLEAESARAGKVLEEAKAAWLEAAQSAGKPIPKPR